MNKKSEKSKVNTLDYAKQVITDSILNKKNDPLKFNTKEDISEFLMTRVPCILDLGDFSYDPTIGELNLSIVMDANLNEVVGGEFSIGQHMRTHFLEEGWAQCSIVPGRLGVHNTLIRLRHNTITSAELMQQGTRVSRAMDSVLSKQ